MRVALLTVVACLGAALLVPGAANAGSYTTNTCAEGDGWWPSNPDGSGRSGWKQIKPLPSYNNSNWIAFNKPSTANWDSIANSDATVDSGESGKLKFFALGGAGGPDLRGPYDVDGNPRSGTGEASNEPWGRAEYSPSSGGGYSEYHFDGYIACGAQANGLSGVISRTGNINVDGRDIYGVGKDSWHFQQFSAPAGTAVTSISTPGVFTYSSAEGCIRSDCNAAGNRYAAKFYNRQDLWWSSLLYVNGAQQRGFFGTGSYDSNNRAGLVNTSTGSPEAFQPNLGGGASSFKVQIACNSTGGCINSSSQDTHWGGPAPYLRAYAVLQSNNGRLDMTLQDNNSGSATVSTPSSWVRGTQSVSVSGSDSEAGSRQVGLYWDSGRSLGQTSTQGSTNDGKVSCSTGRRSCTISNAFSVDTTSLTNGSHSAYGRSWDDAGNGYAESAAATMLVDNQNPNSGGACSQSLTIPSGNEASDGRKWLRSTVTVATEGCDALSGLSSYKVQYQTLAPNQYTAGLPLSWGSSWQDAPGTSCTNQGEAAAGQKATLSCSFNTSSFPDGTAIRFRSYWVDKSRDSAGNPGNVDASTPSDVRYLDNTAPTLSGVKWQAYKASDASWNNINNGWTNAKKTRLAWDPISAGNGSPISKYFYSYESDLEKSGSGACATQQPDGWLSAVGVTYTPDLIEERTEECRQGKHQVWVWVQDVAGNGAVSSPPSSYKSAAAGTSQVSYDSVPTPETRDLSWAKSDTLMPTGLTTNPADWTTTNSFTLSWTNPTILNTVTQSPIDVVLYQVGARDTLSGSSLADVQTYSSCIDSGAQCSLPGVKAPTEGSHPVRVWVRDAAGNSSLEQSAAGQVNWRNNRCVPNQ